MPVFSLWGQECGPIVAAKSVYMLTDVQNAQMLAKVESSKAQKYIDIWNNLRTCYSVCIYYLNYIPFILHWSSSPNVALSSHLTVCVAFFEALLIKWYPVAHLYSSTVAYGSCVSFPLVFTNSKWCCGVIEGNGHTEINILLWAYIHSLNITERRHKPNITPPPSIKSHTPTETIIVKRNNTTLSLPILMLHKYDYTRQNVNLPDTQISVRCAVHWSSIF